MRFSGLAVSAICTILMTAPAKAVPVIDFDIDGSASSVTVGSISGCLLCSVQTTLASGLESEAFSLAEGESRSFSFFDIRATGLVGSASAAVSATLGFRAPTDVSVTASGGLEYKTFFGFLLGGSLIWDSSVPVMISLADGSAFMVDLSDVTSFGPANTATVTAMVRAVTVVDPSNEVVVTASAVPAIKVPAPAALALLGAGLAGFGVLRRRRAAGRGGNLRDR